MNVGIVVPGFSAHAADWAIPALQAFVSALSREHDVRVVTLRWPPIPAPYALDGVSVHPMSRWSRRGAGVPLFWARVLAELLKLHRTRRFDVMHAFWADEPGLLAVAGGGILRRPAVVSLQGGELVGFPDIGYGLRLLRGRATLVNGVARGAARVTACSDYLLRLARERLGPGLASRLRLVPMGVDLARFRPALRPPTGRTLLSVGTLYPVKQHRLAIEILARVPDARLVIVGEGPERPRLEAAARRLGVEERLQLVGDVAHEQMPSHYHAARVLLHTSRHEAHCTAALEAAASGVPVVGTAVGVIPELGRVGATADELAAHVRALLDSPAEHRRQVEAGRARVLESFTLEHSVDAFSRLYQEAGSSARIAS